MGQKETAAEITNSGRIRRERMRGCELGRGGIMNTCMHKPDRGFLNVSQREISTFPKF